MSAWLVPCRGGRNGHAVYPPSKSEAPHRGEVSVDSPQNSPGGLARVLGTLVHTQSGPAVLCISLAGKGYRVLPGTDWVGGGSGEHVLLDRGTNAELSFRLRISES